MTQMMMTDLSALPGAHRPLDDLWAEVRRHTHHRRPGAHRRLTRWQKARPRVLRDAAFVAFAMVWIGAAYLAQFVVMA